MAGIIIQVDHDVAHAIVRAKGGEKIYDRGLHEVDPIIKTIDVMGPSRGEWFGAATYTVVISSLPQLIAISKLNENDGIRLYVGYLGLGRDDHDDHDTIYMQFHHPEYRS